MMAKMRGIKPEIWTDEKFASVSPMARLLFIGMWNHACDNGHLDDSPIQLKMRVFPADSVDAAALVDELVGADLVVRSVEFLKVKNLAQHQKIDKRFLLLCDHCAHDVHAAFTEADRPVRGGKKNTDTPKAQSAPTVHTPSAPRAPHDEGEGEGEGEGEYSLLPDSDESSETGHPTNPDLERFDEWWDTYSKKTGRKKAEAKWETTIKKKRATADELITATKKYITHQRNIGKHPEYTKDPTTWLNGEHWTDEIPNADAPKPQPSPYITREPSEERRQQARKAHHEALARMEREEAERRQRAEESRKRRAAQKEAATS